MSYQQTELSQNDKKPPIVNPTMVIAAGLAAVLAAFVTSRFGVAETLIGEALAAMIATTGRYAITARLDHMGNAMAGAPIVRSAVRVQRALGRFFTSPSEGRRPTLFGGLLAGVVAFLLGMGTVTAAELSAGKSLPCWIWDNCPQDSPEATLPSVLGGGPSDDPLSIIGDGPSDEPLSFIEDALVNDEQPPAGREPNEGGAPTANENTKEDVASSTVIKPEETKPPEPCDVEEVTARSPKRDVKLATTTTGAGKNKRAKHCPPRPTVPPNSAPSPSPPPASKPSPPPATKGKKPSPATDESPSSAPTGGETPPTSELPPSEPPSSSEPLTNGVSTSGPPPIIEPPSPAPSVPLTNSSEPPTTRS